MYENERWEYYPDSKDYMISTEGRIKSFRTSKEGKILHPAKNKLGYMVVNLSINGTLKSYNVHNLVADTFIPNPDHLRDINHINEDKSDNRLENLERCTHRYNCYWGTRNKRIAENRAWYKDNWKRIRIVETGEEFNSYYECSVRLGVHRSEITHCTHGRIQTVKGYHLEKIEE